MKKTILFCALFLMACNIPAIVTRYEPAYGGPNGFPENGKGIVSFKLSYLGKETRSFWGAVKNDEVTGERLMLTRTGSDVVRDVHPAAAETTVMLEPGTYYLNGFVLERDGEYKENNIGSDFDIRYGWDGGRLRPLLIGFKVEAGKQIRLPDMEFSYRVDEEGKIFYYAKEISAAKAGFTSANWIIGRWMNAPK